MKSSGCSSCSRSLDPYMAQLPDLRSKCRKILDVILAIFNDIGFFVKMIGPLFRFCIKKMRPSEYITAKLRNGKLEYPVEKAGWNQSKQNKGLCVFVPGLSGPHFIYDRYLSRLAKADPEIQCVVPELYKKGNYSFKQVAKPVLHLVEDYMDKNPGKPVTLVGLSLGSLVGAYVQRKLKDRGEAIKTVSLAGPLLGTEFVTRNQKLLKLFKIHHDVRKWLCFGSFETQKLIQGWRESTESANGRRHNDFYISRTDPRVKPYRAGLPIIGEDDGHFVNSGDSHASILTNRRIRDSVISSIVDWTRANQPVRV